MWQLLDPKDDDQQSTLRTLMHLGVSSMKLYIKAVTKCDLSKVGWSCDRAKELLDWFNKTSKKNEKKWFLHTSQL